MISHDETARREEAHVKADMAWANIDRKSLRLPHSRTGGLADMVRSIGTSTSTPPDVRRHRQDHHKQRLRAAAAAALAWTDKHRPWNPRSLDRSRYFPHQSEREINRGQRRCA